MNKSEQKIAAQAISELLTSMPSRSQSIVEARQLVVLYIQDLADLPLAAISQACRDFRRGNCGDGHWAPTAAEIRVQALKYLPRQAVSNKLPHEEKPRDPQERERVRKGFAKLLDELRSRSPAPQERFDPEAKSFSPYKLGMSQEQITELVLMHRRGEDWREKYQLFLDSNDRGAEKFFEQEI